MKFLKNKKQVFAVVTSIVCSVFLVAVAAFAATTISSTTITLSNGETIANSTDGLIDVSISSASGEAGMYVQAVNTAAAITRLNAFRGRVTAAATTTSGSIKTVDLIAKGNGAALTEITALYGSADVNGATVDYLRGAEFSLDDAGSPYGTAALAQGVLISNNSSGTQTESYALDINSGTAVGHKAFTADIRLQNGALISGGADWGWYPTGKGGVEIQTFGVLGETVLQGIYLSADANGVDIGTMRGMEISLDANDSENLTTAVGLRIANNFQTDPSATIYGLEIYADSFANTADIRLSGGAASTKKPEIMSGAGVPAAGRCTANNLGSIYLRTDATSDNAVYICEGAGDWDAIDTITD